MNINSLQYLSLHSFDQPLWYKTIEIIQGKKLNVASRLGGFHLLMSFLGSIDILMNWSGIEQLLGDMYTTNVIQHILSGKAYAQALCGQILVQAALLQHMTEDLRKLQKITVGDLEVLSQFKKGENIKNLVLQNRLLECM